MLYILFEVVKAGQSQFVSEQDFPLPLSHCIVALTQNLKPFKKGNCKIIKAR